MELVLPNNCVALEQEEMMYTDGGGVGRNWWNSRGTLATVFDIGLAIYTGGAVAYGADWADGRLDGYVFA